MPLWPLSTQYGYRCRWGNDATASLDYYNSLYFGVSQWSLSYPCLSYPCPNHPCPVSGWWKMYALVMNSNTSCFEVNLGSNGSCRAYYLQAIAVQRLLWPPLSFISLNSVQHSMNFVTTFLVISLIALRNSCPCSWRTFQTSYLNVTTTFKCLFCFLFFFRLAKANPWWCVWFYCIISRFGIFVLLIMKPLPIRIFPLVDFWSLFWS